MSRRWLTALLPVVVACSAAPSGGLVAATAPVGQSNQDALTRAAVAQPDPEGRWSGRVTVPSRVRQELGLGVTATGALIANTAGGLVSNNVGARRILATVLAETGSPSASPSATSSEEVPVASASVEVLLEDGGTVKGTTDGDGYYRIDIGARKPSEIRSRFQLGDKPIVLNSLPFRPAGQPLSFATTLATVGFRKKFGDQKTIGVDSFEAFEELTRQLEAEAREARLEALRSFDEVAKVLEVIQSENEALMAKFDALVPLPLDLAVPTFPPMVFPSFPPMEFPTSDPMDFPTFQPVEMPIFSPLPIPTAPAMFTPPPAPTQPPLLTPPPAPTQPPLLTPPPFPDF